MDASKRLVVRAKQVAALQPAGKSPRFVSREKTRGDGLLNEEAATRGRKKNGWLNNFSGEGFEDRATPSWVLGSRDRLPGVNRRQLPRRGGIKRLTPLGGSNSKW